MSSLPSSAHPGKAVNTISMSFIDALLMRKNSRTTRLIRLRWTARLETLRDTVMPRRAYPRPLLRR